jgi:hypothetical protein
MRIGAKVRASVGAHPGRWTIGGLVVAAAAGFALYWFAPWNLVVDRRVDEALPTAAVAAEGPTPQATEADAEAPMEPTAEPSMAEAGPVELARGAFRSLEHATSGAAILIELEDGSRFLRLEDLDTSNGPDLRVVLTDRPLSTDWHVWDDGELVDLGPLRGNIGSSNYEIPEALDLTRFETAVVWCRRFSVGFGVAPLRAA